MIVLEEMKTRSFRVTDGVAEKIKEIAGDIGGNQQEALSKLIEVYEFQQGKAILTTKRDDIDTFERYVTALTRMFMGVLEENQNTVELVRTEFDGALMSKDLVIQELQKENQGLKEQREHEILQIQKLTEENEQLQKSLDIEQKELQQSKVNFDNMLSDKEKLNMVLQDSLEEMRENFKKLNEKLISTSEKVKTHEALQEKLTQLESSIQNIQFENERKIFDLEKQHQIDLQKLREQYQHEIDDYQKQYFNLLSTKQAEPRETTTITSNKTAKNYK